MTYAPRIMEESVLARWMGMEIAKMNEGLVTARKPLSALLIGENPSSVTKKGEAYAFDRSALRSFAERIPEDLRRRLKLPILFYAGPDIPHSCSCPDEAALEALQLIGEVSSLRTMQGRQFWVSRPIVYAIMKKYPTLVQIVMGA